MYLQHWGMDRKAFDNSHAPEFFVPVESSMLALTKIRYAVSMGLGCVCVHGASGVGKTELMRIALCDFDNSGWATIYLANPAGDRNELFTHLLHKLAGEITEQQTPLEALENKLTQIGSSGGKVLLAIDDAHNITDLNLLEDLRMLFNIEYEGVPVISMIIAGQEQVHTRLAEASRFDSKVAMRVALQPFTSEETNAYVLSRIRNSGCSRGIFTKQAAELIYSASAGNAGNINRLCELALITGYANNKDRIRPDMVKTVAAELGLKNDMATERMLDEIWGDDIPALEARSPAEVDILADLSNADL